MRQQNHCATRATTVLIVHPPQPTADAQEAGAEALRLLRHAADVYPEMRGEMAAHIGTLAAILRLDR